MTVRMPHNTVDSEVYIKTPRGHSGIQMDPLDVLNLAEKVDHTVQSQQGDQGQVDKVQKGEDPKAHQLTQDFWKTPDIWSPRPNRRHNLPANHPSVRQCQLNKVRYRNGSRMEKPHKKGYSRKCLQLDPGLTLSLWPAQEKRQTQLMNFSLTACHLSLHLTMRGDPSP